jgi:hypothetical protein
LSLIQKLSALKVLAEATHRVLPQFQFFIITGLPNTLLLMPDTVFLTLFKCQENSPSLPLTGPIIVAPGYYQWVVV